MNGEPDTARVVSPVRGASVRKPTAAMRQGAGYLAYTTPRPRTAPGSFTTSSAPALRCDGSLTGCALSMSCPLSKSETAQQGPLSPLWPVDWRKPPTAQQRVRLAIVQALGKKPADFPAFLRLMEESGFQVKHGRGGVISFLAPGQDKYTRPAGFCPGPPALIPMTSGR